MTIINTYKNAILIWAFTLYVYWYSKTQLWAAYMALFYRNSLAKIKGTSHITTRESHRVKYNGTFTNYDLYAVQNLETGKQYKLSSNSETIKELPMTPFILLQYSHKDGEPEHFSLDKAYQVAGNKICALYVLHKLPHHLDVRDNAPFTLHIMDKDFNRVDVDLHRQYVVLSDCEVGYRICDAEPPFTKRQACQNAAFY